MPKSNYSGSNTFDGYADFLGSKVSRPLRNNLRVARDGEDITIVYYQTAIIRYQPDGTVVLDCVGYRSASTKRNLNQFSDIMVWQDDGVWYVSSDDTDNREFEDGMEFSGTPSVDH
jgi:hypothetical protein